MSFPSTFPVKRDEYHADLIGKLPDGTQFFITTPFCAAGGDDPGAEFLAVFLFEPGGKFREARIDCFGPRAAMDEGIAKDRLEERMAELNGAVFCDILVSPFSVQFEGTEFGLIAEQETGGIELQPGNSMAFFPPWDGYYDT